MAQPAMPLGDALNKIASSLGGVPAAPTPGQPAATGPYGSAFSPLDPATRQHILNQIYYSQQIPPITHAVLLDMEQKLPELVEYLHSLAGRPAAQADLSALVDAHQSATRSADDQQRLNEIAQVIAQDAIGSQDSKNPLLVAAVGIAAFMAGYTIVHSWNK
jgi:hypothetical protein